ncbi:CoA transferase [Streptomyces sp. RB6PN25]|uniref:CoA transferase n=1 Tax=Streptomyces humicola TaxID=2953240 RepID=A0ABT1Q067_9ACTN|nr:CoA transferase [Streptomyces humicola]MCQ4083274.1 CoA transferase [Streptomyces humicola]
MTSRIKGATQEAWAAVGGAPQALERVASGGPGGVLTARLPVIELARATVTACSLAAAELAAVRSGGDPPAVRVDDGAVAAAFASERHLTIGGRPGATFAPLSGFWRAADGWVRTHANYPHHRARLLAALGIPDGDEDKVLADHLAAVIRDEAAEHVQEQVYAEGGLAVAVRTPQEWAASEPGRASAAGPLIGVERAAGGAAPVRRLGPLDGGVLLPARGVRVLDLTRVIAGPVATRTLALLGADVLRVDSPQLPESADAHADTGFGKRSCLLDLDVRADRSRFEELLVTADVVVTGYRPGALDRYGLSAGVLLEQRPDLIVAQLCAWGGDGPWAARRGFDSLVQAACGIAAVEAAPDGWPGALPAQALDHGTGYLIAAAVLRALAERHTAGGGRVLRFSLAATAAWLVDRIRPEPRIGPLDPYDPHLHLTETDSALGRLRHALPPVRIDGGPSDWSRPPGRPGTDEPRWQ